MEDYVRIPTLTVGEYEVRECSVCSIDDIIGTNADLCTVHFSDEVLAAPDHGYYYAYDYVTAITQDFFVGYYIGNARFCRIGNSPSKEYVLYEYAVFSEDEDGERVSSLLLAHIKMLAEASGASRIICKSKGGDEAFYKDLRECGFTENRTEGIWSLALPHVKLLPCDAVILPREGESLSFYELFFLRERGFTVDSEKCTITDGEDCIIIDRSTGACKLSERFVCLYPLNLRIGDRYTLTVIDALCQLLCQKISGNIRITPRASADLRTTATPVPDITVEDIGIFIADVPLTFAERQSLRERLRAEGKLKKYAVHTLEFNFEIGGRSHNLAYAKV